MTYAKQGWQPGRVQVGRTLAYMTGHEVKILGTITAIEHQGNRRVAITDKGVRQGYGDGRGKVWTR